MDAHGCSCRPLSELKQSYTWWFVERRKRLLKTDDYGNDDDDGCGDDGATGFSDGDDTSYSSTPHIDTCLIPRGSPLPSYVLLAPRADFHHQSIDRYAEMRSREKFHVRSQQITCIVSHKSHINTQF